MLKVTTPEKLDDPTAAAGEATLAYQAPGEAAPPPSFSLPAEPLQALAWQDALEQLLRLLGPDGQGALPGGPVAPAAYVPPVEDPGSAPETPAAEPPPPAAGAVPPPPDYQIESLTQAEPPPLSLDDADLFGAAPPPAIDVLSSQPATPTASFEGMEQDLFGPGGDGVTPIVISKDHRQPDGPSAQPTIGPPHAATQIPDGYVSLLGEPLEIHLSVDDARDLANENGELFIDGDGDDRVMLTGDWVYLGERPDKGATYYSDADGQVALTIHNSESLLV